VKGSKGINSVEVGIRVLDVLARAGGPLALRDVSRLSGLSPSQAHRYLASLIRQAMVVQDRDTGFYDLGPAAVRIGLAALNRLEPIQVAEEALEALVRQIRETAMLAIWGENGPVAVRWKRGSRLLFASVGLGTTFPLLNSTTGRLFLAFMPPEATKSVLEAEIAQAEAAGRKRPAAGLDKLVATIRRDGYAEAESHLAPGIWAATAPVFDSQGQLVAGLTIIGLEADPETERRRSIDLLRAVTAEASQRLGAPT
jgi:DNA-binding IclR family transcriptional regulator